MTTTKPKKVKKPKPALPCDQCGALSDNRCYVSFGRDGSMRVCQPCVRKMMGLA